AFHMRVLKEIAHLSQNYPALPLVLTESKIFIPCTVPDGFAMSIETNRGRYVVCLGEWRDEFALADEAVELIAPALRGDIRIGIGEWRDDVGLADEAVGLVESALRGDIRLRIDISPGGRYDTAERRLPDGAWIDVPHSDDAIYSRPRSGPMRTIFLRNGPVLT